MKSITIVFATVLFLMFSAPDAEAADKKKNEGVVQTVSNGVAVRLGGTLQPRITYGSELDATGARQERIGFGVRRLRLRLYVDIGERFGVFLQMEGSGESAIWQDLRGEYRVTEDLTFRAGRFAGAQPRAYARTLHSEIDAIDRPAISEMWARMTIGGDGRDYGMEALWITQKWELRGFFHNGYNRWNYSSGIGRNPATAGIGTDGFAFSGAATYWPAGRDRFEAGLYGSVNTTGNVLTELAQIGRNYVSYSAHAYWGPRPGDQPFRIKSDFIGISFQEVAPFEIQNYLGVSLFGGYLIASHIELFAMGELWHDDGTGMGITNQFFGTAGGSFSFSALKGRPFYHNRVIAAYTFRTAEARSVDFDNLTHVAMIQAQFYF